MSFGKASLVVFLGACFGTASYAQILDDNILDLGSNTIRNWYNLEQRERIDAAITSETSIGLLLQESRDRIEEAVDADGGSCEGTVGEAQERACAFRANLSEYETFLFADQSCRAGRALNSVTDPGESVDTIMVAVSDATATIETSDFADRDIFTTVRVGSTYPLFEENIVLAECAGVSDLIFATIVIPETSESDMDKLVLAYALALSFRTWEFNRPNVEATAELIRQANDRWSKFETNVIQDQYPWETLLFNDWLAGASSRFTGTLTHPPTQQIRALHPVPTAILDVSGGDTLFRPRLTIEVLGLRYLNESDYTPKRAVSVVMTLKAESGESNGWGLLYTWKRGSLGVVYQETSPNDDVISLVFGIDLANQIDSKRNDLMERWKKLRMDLEALEEQLP